MREDEGLRKYERVREDKRLRKDERLRKYERVSKDKRIRRRQTEIERERKRREREREIDREKEREKETRKKVVKTDLRHQELVSRCPSDYRKRRWSPAADFPGTFRIDRKSVV